MESCSSNLQKNQRISRSCICDHGRKTAMLHEPPFRTGNSCRTFDGLLTDFLFDLHHFAAFGSKKQKCLRTGILRRKKAKKMVHPTRFELMTFYSGGRRSIQLSYGCPYHCYIKYSLFSIFKGAPDKKPEIFIKISGFLPSLPVRRSIYHAGELEFIPRPAGKQRTEKRNEARTVGSANPAGPRTLKSPLPGDVSVLLFPPRGLFRTTLPRFRVTAPSRRTLPPER